MKLVIVESPKKARTIQGFLGPGYRVAASMGHVRDLPAKELGIDVERDFAPRYEILPRAQKALAALRKAVAGAESVLLATDPDREGEAIAWHLTLALRLAKRSFRRIAFHEISRRAIQAALASARDLDSHLIDAQQARRVLDRLVGYQLSPLLWRKVQRGTSAGRVQSVAVKLIVDREREIEAFVPREYWTIDVRLLAAEEDFLARLIEIDGKKAEIPDVAAARALEEELWAAVYRVRETGQKMVTRNPFPPFTTSTLQQAASNRLRLAAKRTMAVAQSLYEAGLITYMRTDSVAVSPEAIAQARQVIAAQFGAAYVPASARRYATRAKNTQEAHEAIRPVEVTKLPVMLRATLSPDEWRVYDLIWKRLIASQMAPARYLQDVALVDAMYPADLPPGPLSEGKGKTAVAGHRFLLKAQATTLVFPGWLAVNGEEEPARSRGGAIGGLEEGRSACPDPERREEEGTKDEAPAPTPSGARGRRTKHLPRPRAARGDGGEGPRAEDEAKGSTGGLADTPDSVQGSEDGEAEAPVNERLPAMAPGQALVAREILPAQHFTQPPRRYTEAALVKAMEEAGVGRPSTYATIVSTIQDRGYVRLEQRHFVPTELGCVANDFLVTHFPKIVDLPFTAEMEDSLDEIAAGNLEWTEMLRAFYGPFAETLQRAARAAAIPVQAPRAGASEAMPARSAVVIGGGRSEPVAGAPRRARVRRVRRDDGAGTSGEPGIEGAAAGTGSAVAGGGLLCPECGRALAERHSQYGPFLGCSGFPACRYIHREPDSTLRSRRGTRTAGTTGTTETDRWRGPGAGSSPRQQRTPPSPMTRKVVRGKRGRGRSGA